jgi:hypothetical protein
MKVWFCITFNIGSLQLNKVISGNISMGYNKY